MNIIKYALFIIALALPVTNIEATDGYASFYEMFSEETYDEIIRLATAGEYDEAIRLATAGMISMVQYDALIGKCKEEQDRYNELYRELIDYKENYVPKADFDTFIESVDGAIYTQEAYDEAIYLATVDMVPKEQYEWAQKECSDQIGCCESIDIYKRMYEEQVTNLEDAAEAIASMYTQEELDNAVVEAVEIAVSEAIEGMYTQEEYDTAAAEAVDIEAAYEYEAEPDSLPAH